MLNVGEPINSKEDDFSFIINEATKQGYFASNRPGGKGLDDIYGFKEIAPLKEDCQEFLLVTVKDAHIKSPLQEAQVSVLDQKGKPMEIGRAHV